MKKLGLGLMAGLMAISPMAEMVKAEGNTPEPEENVKPEPELKPEPKPEVQQPELSPEPEPKPEPELSPEPKPEPKPELKPEPKPEVKPKPEPKPEVKPEPKPEPKPKPELKPEPKPEIKPEPKPEVEVEIEQSPSPQPTSPAPSRPGKANGIEWIGDIDYRVDTGQRPTVAEFDSYIAKFVAPSERVSGKRSKLRGQGKTILSVSEEIGINPYFFVSQLAYESAWGTSYYATRFNNFGGIKCMTGKTCGVDRAGKPLTVFSSVEEGIRENAYLLKRVYLDRGHVKLKEVVSIYLVGKRVGNLSAYEQANVNRYMNALLTTSKKFGMNTTGIMTQSNFVGGKATRTSSNITDSDVEDIVKDLEGREEVRKDVLEEIAETGLLSEEEKAELKESLATGELGTWYKAEEDEAGVHVVCDVENPVEKKEKSYKENGWLKEIKTPKDVLLGVLMPATLEEDKEDGNAPKLAKR